MSEHLNELVRSLRFAFSLLALLAMAACGSPTTPSTPGTTEPIVTSNGSMSAKIDGIQWDAVTLVVQKATASGVAIFSMGGGDGLTNSALTLTLGTLASVGTYQFGGLNVSNGTLTKNPALWVASPAGGNGTITVTTVTATGVTGTFSLNLVPAGGGASGTRVVTNGVFNVTF